MAFVHLHNHSDYSFLDGMSKVSALAIRAKELGQSAITLTDHGVMHGAIQLIKQCGEHGIKPIIGNEMYIINGDCTATNPARIKKYHMLVLAKNTQGYKNLCKLTSISHLQGKQGAGIMKRPCIDKFFLEKHAEGLIVTSGCLAGEMPQLIMAGKADQAKQVAEWYQQIFGDDFYIEIQDHGLRGQPEQSQGDKTDEDEVLKRKPDESIVNPALVKIAQELGIKIIATNDSHFTCLDDREAHDALLCIQTKKLVTDIKRMRYTGTEYLKSEAEMLELFSDHLPREVVESAIAQTQEVADKISDYDLFGVNRMPEYPLPPGISAEEYLRELAWNGLRDRLGNDISLEYIERLEYELGVLISKGFAGYFLVVWDYIKFAKDQGIPTGIARGSAGGSLAAYCLGITNIDPVHHGLFFERFLNPDRISMPDVDTDFCIKRRGEVVNYVTQKYGKDKVTQIGTFTQMKSRSVVKDVGRVLNVPFIESQRVTESVPVIRGNPAKLKDMIGNKTPDMAFKKKYEENAEFKHWIDLAIKLENTTKTSGVHAAGIVISPVPLDEIVPLALSSDGNVVTQYDDGDIEELGLLKMDFLGLRNLTIIDVALKQLSITEKQILNKDKSFHPEWGDKLPEDVQHTYDMMCRGDVDGVFQMESSGMRQLIKDFKPSCFADLSMINALYRPGILDNGMLPIFIKRKNGQEDIDYPHPSLEPVLKDGYGIPIYQEQVMKIAQVFSGYSLAEADMMRKAMGKKKPEEMTKQKSRFIDGAIGNGVDKEIAENVFSILEKYSSYAFNLAHSMAYGYIAYLTAYLKANHPVEFMAALLTGNSDEPDKLPGYISATRAIGIKILPPDINKSSPEFLPEDGNIRYGLGAIRNIGDEVVQGIQDDRLKKGEYKSLAEFCDRTSHLSLNSRALESLILSGCFDCIDLDSNRNQMMNDLESLMKWAKSKYKESQSNQLSLFTDQWDIIIPPKGKPVKEMKPDIKLEKEREVLGFYLSETPVTRLRERLGAVSSMNIAQAMIAENNSVHILATVEKLKPVTTKKGDSMAFVELADETSKIDAVMFPNVYSKFLANPIKDAVVFVSGDIEMRNDKQQLVIKSAIAAESVTEVLVVHLFDEKYRKHISEILEKCNKFDAMPTLIFSNGNFICTGAEYWAGVGCVAEIKRSGYYATSVEVGEVRSLGDILTGVEWLWSAESVEDLEGCDRAFRSVSADFKVKVWSACPSMVRVKVKSLKNIAQVA